MSTHISTVVRRVALAALLASVGGYASAQPVGLPRPMERSEPHEALAFYEGNWTILDKGSESYRETCSWLPEGRRHIVCRAHEQTANGTMEAMSVYSYDPATGEYLYHGFKAGGRVSIDRCRPIPNGFGCLKEHGTGAGRVRERFTIEERGGGRVTAVSETAKADGPWVIEDKTEYLRTRP